MTNEQILENLIKCYQNDIQLGLVDEVSNEEYKRVTQGFSELIIEFTRFIHDIRYCSNKECRCSPEHKIKQLVEEWEPHVNNIYYLSPMDKKWILEVIQ